jgi:hypothetical protein
MKKVRGHERLDFSPRFLTCKYMLSKIKVFIRHGTTMMRRSHIVIHLKNPSQSVNAHPSSSFLAVLPL